MVRTRAFGLFLTFLAGLAASLIILSSLQANAQDAEKDKQVRELFRRGMDEFYEGRYEASYETFNQCLALRPSYRLALELRREAGFQFFVEALSKEGDLGFVLRKFLEIIEKKALIEEPDESRIKKYLEEIKSVDYRKKYMAVENLLSLVGQYCVPYCVEPLGNRRNDDYRTDIIVLLWRMEQDAALPVIEILNSSDSFTRQNAAVVLGHIGDRRAVPALLARLEDPNEDEHVKGSAADAVVEMKLRMPDGTIIRKKDQIAQLPRAAKWYYELAQRYYYDDLAVIINNYKDWLYWFWVEEEQKPERKLAWRKVDRFEFNELLAEEACYEALELVNDYDDVWTLLLCVLFAELNEVDAALEVMVQKEDISSVELDKFRTKRTVCEKCQTVCYTRGKAQLYKALRRSLDDRNALVAVSCINSIKDLDSDGRLLPEPPPPPPLPGAPKAAEPPPPPPPPPVGTSLIAALNYPDKRVRYAAAEALVYMNAKKIFLDANKVVPTLIEALGESAPRVILVIEYDQQIANRLVHFIREIGYMPVLERDGLNGLSRAKSFPTQDMVIISTELPDMKAFEIIDALREDYRTKDVPVFVMAPETRLRVVRGLYAGRADDIISNKIDKLALRDKLDRGFSLPHARQDAPARAIEIARRAAEALAHIDLENANFLNWALSIGPLEEVCQKGTTDQPRRLDYDVVRLPAMRALGRFGEEARATLDTLCDIFSNDNNKKEIRVGAADAIGGVVRPSHKGSALVYTTLREGLNDRELAIQNAAAKALGKADWTPEECLGVFVDQRPHKNER